MKAKLSFWARSVIVICMLVVGCSQAWADYYLKGQFNNWDDTKCMNGTGNSCTVELTAGQTYEFKVLDKGKKIGDDTDIWYGLGQTITESCTKGLYKNDGTNCKITASVTGTYTFSAQWVADGDNPQINVTVTYPSGPTVTFTPAAGSYTEAKNLQVTLSGEADAKTYTYSVTKNDDLEASGSIEMSTTSVTETVYNATENGTYVVTVKDADDNVLATATYTIAIETKYAVEVSAGANGNVSPSGEINVGTTPVAISATAASGYQFKQWTTTGGVTVTNAVSANTTITATSAGTVEALFEEYTAPDMSYYLVGNFFDDDPADEINYDRRYFKFNIQSDGKYMVEIPAAVTARAQIIGVTDQVYKFGPISNDYGIKADWPKTDQTVSGSFGDTNTSNYWNLTTRNNSNYYTEGGEDDGLYEVWFELDESGNPSQWSFKHVSTKRVAYFLSDAEGATANPVYNSRNGVDAGFSNRTYAMVYINPEQSYYTIGYVLRDKESAYISKATAYGAHVNQRNEAILPTTNKLFLMGNNGRTFKTENPYNEVSPHVAAIKVNDKQAGLYKVEYNPSNGNNEWAKGIGNGQPDNEKNTVGIRGQFMFIGGTSEDSPISSISMVGNAIPGTTNGNGTWDWESTAGDMTYDENDGCYKLTIQTTASESKNNRFRFVANHNQAMTWYEDGTTDDKTARVPYASAGTGHSCLPTDPNAVSYTASDNTDNTDLNIIFNRPAGTWTIRFYIDVNEQGQKSYRYTITGKEDVTLTLVCNKYIRTYSNSVSMDMPVGMKAYEAYKFEDAYSVQNIEDNGKISVYDNCRVYLRELKYIPANMGVVLVVDQVEQESEATKKFTLQTRSAKDFEDYRDVWVRGNEYKANDEQWNNFLVPTVTANNNVGNASYDDNGNVTYRHFGLSNYHSTAYYQKEHTGDDYLGFFRLTANGKSGANKAYLSIPSSWAEGWDDSKQALYGVLNYNAQFSGQETDEDGKPSLAKAMILFDDIRFDKEDNIVTGVTSVNQNADNSNVYYNMQGVRVLAPTKGLYISNGKKIIIK